MLHSRSYLRYFPSLLFVLAGMMAGCAEIREQAPPNTAPDATAQEGEEVPPPEERSSPLMTVRTTLADGTYLSVHYGSPRKRGRDIFGGIVPYGQVWRTGANEATELTLTGDITFAGRPVAAGTYALFSIPNAEIWTIILNSGLGQWGAFTYDASLDVLRVEVPATSIADTYEAFTMVFDPEGETLSMMWDQTRVTIPVSPR